MSEDPKAEKAKAVEPEGLPTRVVSFGKGHGVQADVKVHVVADKAERAIAQARAALHTLADTGEAVIK